MIITEQLTIPTTVREFNELIKNFRTKSGFMSSNYNANSNEVSTSSAQTTEKKIDWSKRIVLIAEDEDTNFFYLESALLNTKIQILRAKNGKEAVELARITPTIDVILMDIKMPEMNGIEATRSIKSFRKDIPIVAQTAFAMDEDRRNCMAVGCDDFLAKPVRYKILVDTLAKFL